MTEEARKRIDNLAKLAFGIARPRSYKPYAVERLFRESVKAVTNSKATRLDRADYINLVSGRVMKAAGRGEQMWRPSQDQLKTDKGFDERADEYASLFVDEILYGLCNGKPSRLKRLSNNLSDGFYAATLRLMRDSENNNDNE